MPREGLAIDLDSNPVPCWVEVEGERCEGWAHDLVQHPSGWHVRVRYFCAGADAILEQWFMLDDVAPRH